MKKIIAWAVIATITTLAIAQGHADKTINIDFKDDREDGVKLNMSLPITFLESFAPHLQEAVFSLKSEEFPVDFKAMWASVKESGPNDFVEINEGDTHVKVSTSTTHLLIKANVPDEGDVEVSLPLVLCDAIFGYVDHMDFDQVINALVALEDQELVRIRSDHINGRLWIE